MKERIGVYLSFGGITKEALDYYSEIFGGDKPDLVMFSDLPDEDKAQMGDAENFKNMAMHGGLDLHGLDMGGSDMLEEGERPVTEPSGFYLVYKTDNADRVRELFDRMKKDGGHVIMDIENTFFSDAYGILSDKFGINWMLMVEPRA